MQDRFDVAVVGLGPVGCLATLLLAEAGLSVAVFEKDAEVYRLPRAVNLDGEIIRALQPIGLADAVNNLMQKIRPGQRAGFANSKREWLFGAASKPVGSNGWQSMNMFDQPELEQFLRDTALSYNNVAAWIGASVVQLDDRPSEVAISAERSGENIQVSAQYVLACDGASSSTRKALEIEWRDLGYNRDWLVVDVTVNDKHTLDNDVLQVCDPDRLHTYVPTKDPYRRWEFRLNAGETRDQMLQEETIRTLIDPWTPRDSYQIRRAAVYQFHAATAAEWRSGRIFLAGDAAHQTPPFLGQGMNTGMRDVINLAWKLPLVLEGTCKPELLNTYQLERDAHAHDLVAWAVALGRLMEFVAEQEDCERRGAPAPEPPSEIADSGYGQGREQPPIRKGVVVADQVTAEGTTGYLITQPTVGHESQPCRLDDLLGNGFALMGHNLQQSSFSEESRRLIERLKITLLELEEVQVLRGRLTEVPTGEVALVRPDKILFGQTQGEFGVDQLLKDLADTLCVSP